MKNLLKNLFTNRILKLLLFIVVLLNISMPAWAGDYSLGVALYNIIGGGLCFILLIFILFISFNSVLTFLIILNLILAMSLWGGYLGSSGGLYASFDLAISMLIPVFWVGINIIVALSKMKLSNRLRTILISITVIGTLFVVFYGFEETNRSITRQKIWDHYSDYIDKVPSKKLNSSTYPLLCAAAKNRDIEAVGKILKKMPPGESKQKNLALSLAIDNSDIPMINLLIENGANVNKNEEYKSTRFYTPSQLMIAFDNKDNETVKNLLLHGADPNVRNSNGVPLLDLVAENGDDELLEALIKAGASVNEEISFNEYYKTTALAYAISSKHLSTVKILLEYGANPNSWSIQYWEIHGLFDDRKEIRDLLRTCGMKTRKELEEEFLQAISDDNRKLISEYIARHLYFDDNFLYNALRYAVYYNYVGFIKQFFLDIKVNKIDIKEKNRKYRVYSYVKNVKYSDGNYLIHYATKNGNDEIIKMLINNGANVNAINNENKTPLDLVSERSSTYKLLRKYGAKTYEELNDTIPFKKSQEQVKKDNAKPRDSENTLQSNYLESKNFPPLLSAILNKDAKGTAELIAQGADVNQRDKAGYTPLMYAVMYNNADIVKQLLDAKADINATIPAGDKQLTALQIASTNNYTDIVKLLKQAGAKE